MKNKITVKLIITIVVSISLLVGIMAPVYFYLQPKLYINQEERYVSKFSEKLKSIEPFDKESITKFVSDSGVPYRIYVFDENFTPLYTSLEFGDNQKFIENLFKNKMMLFQTNSEAYYSETDNEQSVKIYTRCIVNNNTYYIYIKDNLSSINKVFNISNKVLGYVVIGYIIICSIVLFLAISPSVKSVKEVTKVAKKISENNLSVRYQGTIHNNEIGDLALSVNKMADTIQNNINDLKNYNFVLSEDNRYMEESEQARLMLLRNITHDLKTPLAVISSQVEMISTCKEQEKKDYYYQSAMDEIDKMSKMISNVLQMTVDERRIVSKESQIVDISDLITKLCDNNSAYIKSCNLKLDRNITINLKLDTIKEYVEFVFRNYLSNAVQNAQKNTSITVTLEKHKNKVRLSVENIGQHISDNIKDKIWTEAFTTLPEGKDNTGLGLYIVKEIALKEHTECGFDNTENGVCFWFDFTDYTNK